MDFQRKLIHIPKTKAGQARHIPMNDVVIEALQSIPPMLHNPYVFYGQKVGEYLPAGIEDFHLHDSRHTFASWLLVKRVDLYTVSKLMGHYSTEVRERYAHLASAHLQRAVDSLTIPGAQVTPKVTPAKDAFA
jgi:integrase